MPYTQDRIVAQDDPNVDVTMHLWSDSQGKAVCALEPNNDSSFQWVADNRQAIRAGIQEAHGLADAFNIYEGQGNGMYTATRLDGDLEHGASISFDMVKERGIDVESKPFGEHDL